MDDIPALLTRLFCKEYTRPFCLSQAGRLVKRLNILGTHDSSTRAQNSTAVGIDRAFDDALPDDLEPILDGLEYGT
jgi:hypothetical protein